MNEERALLAEALWALAKPEHREYIREFNKTLAETPDETYYEVTEQFKADSINHGMTESLFEALDTAYTIMDE